jgi:hypothetical protein
VVVDDLNAFGTGIAPDEAQAELVVDADEVLTASIPGKEFEAVPRRDAQIIKSGRDAGLQELASGDLFEGNEPPDAHTLSQGLGIRAAERSDHG